MDPFHMTVDQALATPWGNSVVSRLQARLVPDPQIEEWINTNGQEEGDLGIRPRVAFSLWRLDSDIPVSIFLRPTQKLVDRVSEAGLFSECQFAALERAIVENVDRTLLRQVAVNAEVVDLLFVRILYTLPGPLREHLADKANQACKKAICKGLHERFLEIECPARSLLAWYVVNSDHLPSKDSEHIRCCPDCLEDYRRMRESYGRLTFVLTSLMGESENKLNELQEAPSGA